MARLSEDRLVLMALRALVEVAQNEAKAGAIAPRTDMLRFTLAWLFQVSGADPAKEWIFQSFWKNVTAEPAAPSPADWQDAYIRARDTTGALRGIIREVGYGQHESAILERRPPAPGRPRRGPGGR